MLTFEQPAGKFGLTTMPVQSIISIASLNPRTTDPEKGIQRKFSPERVKKIAEFVDNETDNIVFPTPIILSLPSYNYDEDLDEGELRGQDYYKIHDCDEITGSHANDFYKIEFLSDSQKFANLIDGQHRLLGIEASQKYKTNKLSLCLPVLFVIGADLWTQAYLFAKVNGEQKQVPYSFVSDLFQLSPDRSIEQVAHKIIYALNHWTDSPLEGHIKMLGIVTDKEKDQSLSQGSMAREFQRLIRPKGVLHKYYDHVEDESLMNLIVNYFSAIAEVWPADWADSQSSIIRKTVGFTGFIKAFPEFFKQGKQAGNLDTNFFKNHFENVKKYFEEHHIQLTSAHFPSNAASAGKLKNVILLGMVKK